MRKGRRSGTRFRQDGFYVSFSEKRASRFLRSCLRVLEAHTLFRFMEAVAETFAAER
jgi:hypothetical protein